MQSYVCGRIRRTFGEEAISRNSITTVNFIKMDIHINALGYFLKNKGVLPNPKKGTGGVKKCPIGSKVSKKWNNEIYIRIVSDLKPLPT